MLVPSPRRAPLAHFRRSRPRSPASYPSSLLPVVLSVALSYLVRPSLCMSVGPTSPSSSSTLSPFSSSSSSTTAAAISRRPIRTLYAGDPDRYSQYAPLLLEAFRSAGLNSATLSDDAGDRPETYDYIVHSPRGPVDDFGPFAGARAILSLRAGVDWVGPNPTLPRDVPVARMVDPGLRAGMVEYVVGHAMRHHLRIDDCAEANRAAEWKPAAPTLASERRVGVLGVGELGGPCAEALSDLGFRVTGWSRTGKGAGRLGDRIERVHGPEGLDEVLKSSDILVLLLPGTPQTENLIDERTLSKCKPDVAIINAGRGSLIDDDALLSALDSGRVSGATLDVFREEPLPQSHQYWSHPRVLVTPHVAAKTRAETACGVVAENIRRSEMGEDLLYVVDREAGY